MKSKYVKPTLIVLGCEIRTIEVKDLAYVSARATAEVFNLDWRTQKSQLLDPDSVILYGVIDISTPEFADIVSLCSGYRADKQDDIYIRMDRAMMYIARVSTARMRANGNHEGADAILAKQVEYAQALHDYETFGIAINRNHFGYSEQRRKQRLAVISLLNAKRQTSQASDRKLLNDLIADAANEAGVSYQPELPGV